MSIEAITFVKLLDLGDAEGPAARLLLYVLAENLFNDSGECKVGQAELALQVRVSERTIRRQLRELEPAILRCRARYPEHGGRETDAIELVGFKDWLSRQRQVAQPANLSGSLSNAGGATGQQVSGVSGQQVSGSYKEDRTRAVLDSPPNPQGQPAERGGT